MGSALGAREIKSSPDNLVAHVEDIIETWTASHSSLQICVHQTAIIGCDEIPQ
jgi:hypothetical protein